MGKITQKELDKMLELHKLWLDGNIKGIRLDLSNEDVSNLNMQRADMQWANMQGADIDFSSWPLWCGSLGVELDKKQKIQLGYHFADTLNNDDPEEKAIKDALRAFVNKFHRIPEVNKIK